MLLRWQGMESTFWKYNCNRPVVTSPQYSMPACLHDVKDIMAQFFFHFPPSFTSSFPLPLIFPLFPFTLSFSSFILMQIILFPFFCCSFLSLEYWQMDFAEHSGFEKKLKNQKYSALWLWRYSSHGGWRVSIEGSSRFSGNTKIAATLIWGLVLLQ